MATDSIQVSPTGINSNAPCGCVQALTSAKRFLESIDAHKHEDGFQVWSELNELLGRAP